MDKSRIKNKHLKWPSREKFLAYKNIKINNLVKKSKKKEGNHSGRQSNLS